jgi:hypothetical protein
VGVAINFDGDGKTSGELIWDAREDVMCIAARTITAETDGTIEETCAIA